MARNSVFFILAIIALALAGCSSQQQAQEVRQGQGQLAAEINVYNWEDYFDEDKTVLSGFEEEYGVKVNLFEYADENFMLTDLQENPGKYDVVITEDDTVNQMIDFKLVAPLNLENIPNYGNIGPDFRSEYDGKVYNVPYFWGTNIIAVNRKYVTEDVDSYSIFWNEKYTGKMEMLLNKRSAIGATLKYLGYSLNSKDPDELAQAGELLEQNRDILAGYDDIYSMGEKMMDGTVWVGQMPSGAVFWVASENEDVVPVLPKEGSEIWVDSMVVPASSRNKKTAELFINYILRPEVSGKIVNYVRYPNPNLAAAPYTDPDILNNTVLYPSKEFMDKSEFIKPLGDAEPAWNELWSRLQLQR